MHDIPYSIIAMDRVKQLSVGKGETFSVKDVITT